MSDVASLLEQVDGELQCVVDFWMKYSYDHVYGGFFDCIEDDGRVFDTNKHIWLQGRQLWMMSKLLIVDSDVVKRDKEEITKMVCHCAKFLCEHAFMVEYERCYFEVSREGHAVNVQRKIFSECFVAMGFLAFAVAVPGCDVYRKIAFDLYHSIVKMIDNPDILGRPRLSDVAQLLPLNVPMILLNVIDEFRALTGDRAFENARSEWCLEQIRSHVHPSKGVFMENIRPDGTHSTTTSSGRLFNPGHSIECAWFVLHHTQMYLDNVNTRDEWMHVALTALDNSFELGWDGSYGGLYAFLDIDPSVSPAQLEWSMKLWWPHTEAMIAFSTAYLLRGHQQTDLEKLKNIVDFSLKTFKSRSPNGGWYGYADRKCNLTHKHIGAAYKGFFHVPRCLFMCSRMLKSDKIELT